MYYKYRKKIYTALIIFSVIVAFFIGKMSHVSHKSSLKSTTTTKSAPTTLNKNYNSSIEVKGTNYSSTLIVNKATISDDNTLLVNITESDQENVSAYKVLAFGANNNALDLQQTNPSNLDNKTFQYSIKFSDDDKDVKIKIYPLTAQMQGDPKLNLNDNLAYAECSLNIDEIRKDTINQIKGSDGSGQ